MADKLVVFFLLLNASACFAIDLDPDDVISSTLKLLVDNKPNDAFENAIKTNLYFNDMKSSIDSAKIEFVSFINKVGSPTKCEKLASRSLVNAYRKDIYLCLSPKQPFELNFDFYKQEKTWRIQSFSFSSNIDDVIEASMRDEIGQKSKSRE